MKRAKQLRIGTVLIGAGAPVSVQSMTNTDTRDIDRTLDQIRALEEAGCEIVRLAVPDFEAAEALKTIKEHAALPLVADIHFDYRLALEAMKAGVDALRLNPGNIRDKERVKLVIDEARARDIVIRVGVNAGSIDRKKYPNATAEDMVASAYEHIRVMEDRKFTNIKVSLKASNVQTTIDANVLFRKKFDYPLHLGVTEAGTLRSSLVKSALGIGSLLLQGIGETIRVSITGDPVEEVYAGKMILTHSGARDFGGVEIVSCPTCGRTTANLEPIALELERRAMRVKRKVTVAVMGCVVNGPGEARHADFGIAGKEDGNFLFFEKDKNPITILRDDAVNFLMTKINEYAID